MTGLDVLADHLDAFDLNQLERADIFHAYDLAPEGQTFNVQMALDYAKSPAQTAWRRARQIPLRKNGGSYETTLLYVGPAVYAATKMDILTGLARARDILSGVDQ